MSLRLGFAYSRRRWASRNDSGEWCGLLVFGIWTALLAEAIGARPITQSVEASFKPLDLEPDARAPTVVTDTSGVSSEPTDTGSKTSKIGFSLISLAIIPILILAYIYYRRRRHQHSAASVTTGDISQATSYRHQFRDSRLPNSRSKRVQHPTMIHIHNHKSTPSGSTTSTANHDKDYTTTSNTNLAPPIVPQDPPRKLSPLHFIPPPPSITPLSIVSPSRTPARSPVYYPTPAPSQSSAITTTRQPKPMPPIPSTKRSASSTILYALTRLKISHERVKRSRSRASARPPSQTSTLGVGGLPELGGQQLARPPSLADSKNPAELSATRSVQLILTPTGTSTSTRTKDLQLGYDSDGNEMPFLNSSPISARRTIVWPSSASSTGSSSPKLRSNSMGPVSEETDIQNALYPPRDSNPRAARIRPRITTSLSSSLFFPSMREPQSAGTRRSGTTTSDTMERPKTSPMEGRGAEFVGANFSHPGAMMVQYPEPAHVVSPQTPILDYWSADHVGTIRGVRGGEENGAVMGLAMVERRRTVAGGNGYRMSAVDEYVVSPQTPDMQPPPGPDQPNTMYWGRYG
ncbi:hypothetical protein EX30DRAFT_395752 [Ascodesmis nigricans]|uniref:Uncharacterized protein n=1 Tax=Ascodesmis nigricans TaxID=341454 RepID=A0A4S2MX97_9PEZI|nr:hypothetical protein EX30DRAFT_395752 [Ascodesmis nigricans]